MSGMVEIMLVSNKIINVEEWNLNINNSFPSGIHIPNDKNMFNVTGIFKANFNKNNTILSTLKKYLLNQKTLHLRLHTSNDKCFDISKTLITGLEELNKRKKIFSFTGECRVMVCKQERI